MSKRATQPDIIVRDSHSARLSLVVEVKKPGTILKEWEDQLKSYMLNLRCPAGLLVTRDQARIFIDTYESRSPTAIKLFAEIRTSDLFKNLPMDKDNAQREHDLIADSIQKWLQQAEASERVDIADGAAKRAFTEILLPALRGGIIEAGKRRWR